MAVLVLAAHGCFESLPEADSGTDEDSDEDSDENGDSAEGSDSGDTETTETSDPDVGDDTSDGGSGSTGSQTDPTGEDGTSESSSDSGTDSTGTDDGGKVVSFPLSVVECGEGLLDEIDHEIGDPLSQTKDDVRTGSCLPDICAIEGESGTNGVDLEFPVGLPPLLPLQGASFRVRGIVNGGVAGTTEFYFAGSTTRIARCTIDTAETEYGECVAEVDPQFVDMVDRDQAAFYTNHGDPGCYFVYDFIELTVRY